MESLARNESFCERTMPGAFILMENIRLHKTAIISLFHERQSRSRMHNLPLFSAVV